MIGAGAFVRRPGTPRTFVREPGISPLGTRGFAQDIHPAPGYVLGIHPGTRGFALGNPGFRPGLSSGGPTGRWGGGNHCPSGFFGGSSGRWMSSPPPGVSPSGTRGFAPGYRPAALQAAGGEGIIVLLVFSAAPRAGGCRRRHLGSRAPSVSQVAWGLSDPWDPLGLSDPWVAWGLWDPSSSPG